MNLIDGAQEAFRGISMEKLVLSERELSAHWGVNVKTLLRWRAEGRGPRFMKIGRTVMYLPKDIEHFEAYSLYESGRGGAIVETTSPDTEALSTNRSVTSSRPRTHHQGIVDLLAGSLLGLRAAGPPPHKSITNSRC